MTVEDILSRQTRSLLLGAKASIEAARRIAVEMGHNGNRQKKKISDYENIAGSYILQI